jgi:hypothetical protein
MNYTYKLARRLARLRPAAVSAACGRWISDRKIDYNRAVRHHLVCGTFPILTLVLLLAACADSSAPLAPDGVAAYQQPNVFVTGRGWTRKIVRIRIAPDTAVVSPGQTTTFTASGTFIDGRSKLVTVSWAATGGTIDSTGLFTADSTAGLYQVIATEPTTRLTDTAAVLDRAAPVDQPAPVVAAVSVSPSSTSFEVGDSIRLVATAKDAGGAIMGGTTFTWASSDPGVATVNLRGMVKGIADGSAIMTATAQGASGEASVSVTAPAPAPAPPPEPATLTKITLTPASVSLTTGATQQFTVSGTWSDGSTQAVSATYSETGGSISSTGLYTAGSATGSYRVIATAETGSLADTALVTIESPPAPTVSSVSVTPSSATLAVGGSVQLSATAKDAGGATLSGIALTWTSSNPGVATVSSAGVVKGLAGGSATVTATAQGVSGRSAVSVTAPAPAPSPTGDCSDYNYSRLVPVSTASQLTSAITNARPGDLIELAAGTYTGYWSITTSGTSTSRIVLCGPRTANLGGTGTAPSPINLRVQASNWTLQGFTISNAFQPLFLIGAQNVTVKGLEIYNIGQEAIHLHTGAKNNLIEDNYIHDTGKTNPQYGEGVYVGSAQSHWVSGTPDRTDNTTVRNNIIGPNIGAQMVDVKEGTTGTIVSGNTFNGLGSSVNQDAWVNVYGNQSQVLNNTGTTARVHGVKVETLVTGWGAYNVFHGNAWDLRGATGYGFRVGGGTPASTVDLGCDNSVTNADSGFATVPCSP